MGTSVPPNPLLWVLGNCEKVQQEGPSDSNEALKYKLVAAIAGYALAQHDVANHYDRQGNPEEALKWWKAAGDQGYPGALFSLSMAYSAGKGALRDLSLSYAYFKLSKVAPKKNVNEMAGMLSKPELEKAEKLVSEWSAQPTALTLKAKRGVGASSRTFENRQELKRTSTVPSRFMGSRPGFSGLARWSFLDRVRRLSPGHARLFAGGIFCRLLHALDQLLPELAHVGPTIRWLGPRR
jgi:TPR repeat protein